MIVKVIELEKSLLVTGNVWRLFINTLSADDIYSLISKDNSMQTIHMDLSQKQNVFYQFFSAFFEYALKHWFNRNESASIILIDDIESNWIPKVTVCDMKYLNTFC